MRKTATILNICLAFALLFGSMNAQAQIKVANGGNVGIGLGTATPSYKLQVNGNTRIQGYSSILGEVSIQHTTYPKTNHTLSVYGSAKLGDFVFDQESLTSGGWTISYPVFNTSSFAYFGKPGKPIGNVYCNYLEYNSMQQASDQRMKKNITKISDEKPKLNKLNVYKYDLKEEMFNYVKNDTLRRILIEEGKGQVGVMAQELKEIYPELVKYDANRDLYLVNYVGLVPHLLKAVQEQSQEIETLKSEMAFMQVNCCNSFIIDPKPIKDIKTKSYTQTTEAQTTIINNTIIARLDQNIPNPFSENTQISCFIPEQSKQAQLCVYDLTGKQLKQYSISQKGETAVTIQGQELQAGIYLYALLIDGQLVDSKKMVLTK